ncbi:metallophosphatase domain-containing protein [Sphingobacterium deserti]|uniref:Metallophosphoesterase n=1 Tax=Sphingobacterium deserti TaxID=1229276 RepID=A0A0B8T3R6_9SPHI|nr:metallophosphatase domain-containing protein [Sphingobacterium deserti]KGE16217.1 metallophosphoesterase [Sphingobacterium deserti]
MKKREIKVVAISDTHGCHRLLKLPKGDIIIHAGDISQSGGQAEVLDFLDWFAKLNFKHKIFIAGNHDFLFENAHPDVILNMIPKGVTYLNDAEVEVEGFKIWGSPITPWFNNWAFNRDRGDDIKKHWDLIPLDTDILITHGPPLGILDETVYGQRTGCEDLLERIETVKPKYHIFGHIHEDYGSFTKGEITFINASVLDNWYDLRNKPVEISVVV